MKVKVDAQGNRVNDDDPNAVGEIDIADPTPPAPRADPDILNAYQEQLLAETRRNAQLQRELDEARRPAPRAPTPEEEKSFFDTPRTSTIEIVRKEISDAVAPLNTFVQQTQRQQALNTIKQQMRNNPAQFPYINQIEQVFDQILSGASSIDQGTIVTAYNAAVGHVISTKGVEALAPRNDPPPPVPSSNPVPPTPPRVPPTPPAPRNNNTPKSKRTLTANEQKIARYRGMTDDEYIVWTDDVTPTEVGKITDDEIKARMK